MVFFKNMDPSSRQVVVGLAVFTALDLVGLLLFYLFTASLYSTGFALLSVLALTSIVSLLKIWSGNDSHEYDCLIHPKSCYNKTTAKIFYRTR
jgi:hypothetical protein